MIPPKKKLTELIDSTKFDCLIPFKEEPAYSRETVERIAIEYAKTIVRADRVKYVGSITKELLMLKIQELESYLDLAAKMTGTTVELLKSSSRKKPLVYGRLVYYCLARMYTDRSFVSIGKIVNKDHSTISHYLENRISKMFSFGNEIEALIQEEFDPTFSIEEVYYKGRQKDRFINKYK